MADLDEDKLELMERQLAERVTERVRGALFRLYATVGLAVIGVLGFVSWDVVSDIKSEIKSEIKTEIADEIDAKRNEIDERAIETRVIAKRANTVIQRVEKQLDEFEPQAQNLDETIQKVKELNVTAQDLRASNLSQLQPLVTNVESLSQRLVALAQQVDQINKVASGGEFDSATETQQTPEQRSLAIQSVISDSEEAKQQLIQARNKTTVFFQFAGGHREQAESLSAYLKTGGYIVPGEDREGTAAGKHEVRYFHDSDKPAAQQLADDTTRSLRALGYTARTAPDVIVNPLVTYSGKKPRPGVLELWLEIPPN